MVLSLANCFLLNRSAVAHIWTPIPCKPLNGCGVSVGFVFEEQRRQVPLPDFLVLLSSEPGLIIDKIQQARASPTLPNHS